LIESHITIGTIQQTQPVCFDFEYIDTSWHTACPTVILKFMETHWKILGLLPPKLNKTKFH